MTLKFDLRDVAETAGRVAARFWPVLLLAFGAWVCAVELVWHDSWPAAWKTSPGLERHFTNTLFVLSVGLSISLTGCILAERASRGHRWLSWAWVALAYAAIALLLSWFVGLKETNEWNMLRLAAIGGCAHLMVAAAPFLGKGTESGFWQYNRILFIRLFTGVLYTATLFIGLMIAYVVSCELFGYEEKWETIGTLSATLGFIFHTWYFLAGVPVPKSPSPSGGERGWGEGGTSAGATLPTELDSEGGQLQPTWQSLDTETAYPKGIKLFTQFVLLPLVLVYLLILYAYMGKIIVEQSWPKGLVSYLVFGFSILGILAFLLVWPLRTDGTASNQNGAAWIKSFTKGFYIALLPLVALEALALAKRIGDYGLTEERVILLALTVWLVGVTLLGLVTGGRRIRYIPSSLAAVVFLICFGPLEASSLSIKSQASRLESMLTSVGAMKDGKAEKRKEGPSMPIEQAQNLFSMLDYLDDHHVLNAWAGEHISLEFEARMKAHQDREQWKSDSARRKEGGYYYGNISLADSVANYIGFDRSSTRAGTDYEFNQVFSKRTDNFSIKGYDYLSEDVYERYGNDTIFEVIGLENKEEIKAMQLKKKAKLILTLQGDTTMIDFHPLLEKSKGKNVDALPENDRRIPFAVGNVEGVLRISVLSATDHYRHVDNLNYALLYRRAR